MFKKLELPLTALLCAILWGSAFPGIKTAYKLYIDKGEFLNVISFAGIRFFLAGLIVLLFVKKPSQQWFKADKKLLLTVTLSSVLLQYLFFYTGLARVSGITGAILVSTGSFWWLLIAPFINHNDKIKLNQLLFIFMGFTGVCLAVYRPEDSGQNSFIGVLLMLCASFCGALATVFVKPLNKQVSVPFITGFSLCLGGLMLICLSPKQSFNFITRHEFGLKALLIYLSIASATAFSLWYGLVSRYDVARLSTYRFLIPICGSIESAIFLGEKLFFNTVIGGILVIFSAWFLEKQKRHKKATFSKEKAA